MVGTRSIHKRSALPRPTKTKTDATVGRLLAEARLRRGVSLPAAAQALNIPVKQLESLEAGDLSVFQAEVYARGAFIKYADYLGVRAQHTQHAFMRALSGAREYVPLRVHTPRTWLARMVTPRAILAAVIGLCGLVVGSYLLWQVQAFLRLPSLAVYEPVTDVVQGSSVTVRGHAEPSAELRVNDAPVLLSPEGNFEMPLLLHPGINVLQIEAENAAGRKTIITRHLLMPRR